MKFVLRMLVVTVAIVATTALIPPAAMAVEGPAAAPMTADFLFVQNAATVAVGDGGRTLTLKGIGPTTLFFADRPLRVAGHYRLNEYLDLWKAGPDSFFRDPPNAALSTFEKGKEELSEVVVTLRNPRLSGNDLTYDINVISGKLPPADAGPASLFIDIIGLPFTPLSFAGVARRTARRTVIWGSAAAAAGAAAAHAYYTPPPATVTVVHTAAPAPAPAVSATESAAVAKLKELKSLQSQGLISEEQYKAESQKLLNEIVQ
jgi:hypothetical protein